MYGFCTENPVQDEDACAGFSVASPAVLVMIPYAGAVVDEADAQ